MHQPIKPIKRIAAGWTDVVLVCRKCSKKLDGGFGPEGEQTLAKALRRFVSPAGTAPKGRRSRIGIVEVGCLGLCPKRAVVTIRAGAPGGWLVVPAGTALDRIADGLGVPKATDR